MKRLFLSVAAAALAIGLLQSAHGFASAQNAPQATPTPIMPPGVLPTTQPNKITITLPRAKPKATPTPAAPKELKPPRVGISGVWEVQIQKPSGTKYTHFKITQSGQVLTGQYLDANGKKYPLSGTVDQKDVHIVVSLPSGTALVFSGTVDENTDMEGTLDTSSSNVIGFTASYRPKYKWLDNLSPNPGLPGTP